MSSKINKFLTQVATYLNVPCGKITLDQFGVPVRTINNTSSKSLFNILKIYLKEASKEELLGKTEYEQAQVYQFIEYASVYIIGSNLQQIVNEILPHIHGWLAVNTYLCGTKMTIADIILYYLLFDTLSEISHLEQVRFLNVFRWLDNIQENRELRQKNSIILFNTNLASCGDMLNQKYIYNF
ncbi:eukaryotic translation elongation factor 1 epsilon-1 [Onthophagus taurus]|uniref:eukaryotic translation elongation factor 1 epsilon-1 n=1 Tax=Onthophagus taurus TaxID=166361 RepID=UPI000C202DBA|nr:eukaryotic translation elongation factor 1 epsilon-1 [Onthophagus taurus]